MKPAKKAEILSDTESNDGTVVYWYDQSEMPAAMANPVLSKGMCQALCMLWVALKKARANFHRLLINEAAINPHAQTIMTAQNSVLGTARASGGDVGKAYGDWMVRWGQILGYTVRVAFSEGTSAGPIGKAILQAQGYTIMGFQNDRGGHAMVANFSGDNVEFFDPNAGEFRIPRTEFQEWFATFFFTMNYQTSPTRFWAMVHIN